MSDVLSRVLADWTPAPVSVTRTIGPAPLEACADLLDEQVQLAPGSPVPALWHWLAFTHSCPQSSLGEDGHPRDGDFLPPFENRRRMMAGGRLEQAVPFAVGSVYRRDSELAGAQVKDGRTGRMLFTTIRHTFVDDAGSTVAVEEEDVVYRQQPAGGPRGLPSVEPAGAPWHEPRGSRGRLSFPSDPRLLFRFSALTYNAHRIHYDVPYTVGVEGYPGLVVHGPLLALQMLELPRRAGLRARRVEYRLLAPVFAGSGIIATWDGWELRAGPATAGTQSARATFAA
jgi:3-methylfumaryl-CoA hydratase